MKTTNLSKRGLPVMMICVLPLVFLAFVSISDIHSSRNSGNSRTVQRQDDPTCYTIDRSRPEWLGEPTPVERGPEDEPGDLLPKEFGLDQSYPNPFNPVTTINFQVPKSSRVTIKIFDMLGRQVRMLVEEDYEPGFHAVEWDGKDDAGRQVATGTYLYMMKAGDFVKVRKGMLVK